MQLEYNRGDQDNASNDKCPKCGAMYMADIGAHRRRTWAFTYPVPRTFQVTCFMCDHTGPIGDWWDAFDKMEAAICRLTNTRRP